MFDAKEELKGYIMKTYKRNYLQKGEALDLLLRISELRKDHNNTDVFCRNKSQFLDLVTSELLIELGRMTNFGE